MGSGKHQRAAVKALVTVGIFAVVATIASWTSKPVDPSSALRVQAADDRADAPRHLAAAGAESCGVMVQHKFNCSAVACEDKVQGYINYIYFKECTMESVPALAYIMLVVLLLYWLFLLGDTADEFFCPALQSTVTILKLSPNIAGVTFLSFGNGAPDVFASLAAFTHGTPKIGIGALVGAGIVVTMGVAGAVAVTCDAKINRRPFLRDAGFYVLAVAYLMIVFFDGKVVVYESLGFLAIYLVFVLLVGFGRVVYVRQKTAKATLHSAHEQQRQREARVAARNREEAMQSQHMAPLLNVGGANSGIRKLRSRSHDTLALLAGLDPQRAKRGEAARHASFDHHNPVRFRRKHWTLTYMSHLAEYYDPSEEEADNVQPFLRELQHSVDEHHGHIVQLDIEQDEPELSLIAGAIRELREMAWYAKIFNVVNFPATFLRRITIPLLDDDTWAFWSAVVTPFFGLVLFVQVAFGFTSPLVGSFAWGELAVYLGTVASIISFFKAPRDAPPEGKVMVAWIFFAFVVSVVWIIILANEVVGLLLALGLFLGVSNTILGLTVLAWGNSLGDLVADVTVAKEGLPAMAIAGCFAGPMFNMLVGLGLSTTIATLREGSISLGNDSSTVNLSFAMLLLSLVSSMIVVPMSGFRFKRPYGIVLILVYFVFLAVTILLQTGAVKFHFFGPDGGAS